MTQCMAFAAVAFTSKQQQKNDNWQHLAELEQQRLSCQAAAFLRRAPLDYKPFIFSPRRAPVLVRQTANNIGNIWIFYRTTERQTSKLQTFRVSWIKQACVSYKNCYYCFIWVNFLCINEEKHHLTVVWNLINENVFLKINNLKANSHKCLRPVLSVITFCNRTSTDSFKPSGGAACLISRWAVSQRFISCFLTCVVSLIDILCGRHESLKRILMINTSPDGGWTPSQRSSHCCDQCQCFKLKMLQKHQGLFVFLLLAWSKFIK